MRRGTYFYMRFFNGSQWSIRSKLFTPLITFKLNAFRFWHITGFQITLSRAN